MAMPKPVFMALAMAVAAISLLAAHQAAAAPLTSGDVDTLLMDFAVLPSGGQAPGALLLTNTSATALVEHSNSAEGYSATVAAAAAIGNGYVLAFGHSLFMDPQVSGDSMERWLRNTVSFCDNGAALSSTTIALDAHSGFIVMKPSLAARGVASEIVAAANLDSSYKVLVVRAASYNNDPAGAAVVNAWVRNGGCAIVSGTGYSSGLADVTEFGGYLLAAGSGIVWPVNPNLQLDTSDVAVAALGPYHNNRLSLDSFADVMSGSGSFTDDELAVLANAADLLVRNLQPLSAFPAIEAMVEGYSPSLASLVTSLPTSDAREKAIIIVGSAIYENIKPGSAYKQLLSQYYPGSIRNEPAERSAGAGWTASVNGDYAGMDETLVLAEPQAARWEATGFWVPAGEQVTISLPAGASGLQALIGGHTDDIGSADTFYRYATVKNVWPLAAGGSTTISSVWGGSLYILVPVGSALGSIDISAVGVVKAPTYSAGSTPDVDWVTVLRHLPAPYAQLKSSRASFLLPSDVVGTLDSPMLLLGTTDSLLDAMASLTDVSLERARPTQIVADMQIAGPGAIHAGYPIVLSLDALARLLDFTAWQTPANWDLMYAMAQNHHRESFRLPGKLAAASDSDLIALYSFSEVLDSTPGDANAALEPATRMAERSAYLDAGAALGTVLSYTQSMDFFLQLQEAFSWTFVHDLLAIYEALPAEPDVVNLELLRRERLCTAISEAAQHDLGWYCVSWGLLPNTSSVLETTRAYAPWTGNPMLQHAAHCGDGVVTAPEACDEHGMTAVGCSESCDAIKPYYRCEGAPSVCSRCTDESCCSGHGIVLPDTSCACAGGWGAANCSVAPLCVETGCNGRGSCNSDGSCACTGTAHGEACEYARLCDAGCNSHGVCHESTGECVCSDGWSGAECNLAPPCVTVGCNGRGSCNAAGTCACTGGYTGSNCEGPRPCDVSGCSNHGSCNAVSGECTCTGGWSGADCSVTPQCLVDNCSGRGSCFPDGSCDCRDGWVGANCDVVPPDCTSSDSFVHDGNVYVEEPCDTENYPCTELTINGIGTQYYLLGSFDEVNVVPTRGACQSEP